MKLVSESSEVYRRYRTVEGPILVLEKMENSSPESQEMKPIRPDLTKYR